MSEPEPDLNRRNFLRRGLWSASVAGLGATGAILASSSRNKKFVWQIDPYKCICCGKCATCCVLTASAVKCIHAFAVCGYCDLCTGYLEPEPTALDTAAENQLCPTGAIKRTFVEDPYYEYTIDKKLCIGCGKCVEGCNAFGNGSLFLQIMHDRCLGCNDCAIAAACPTGAIKRVPADTPYIIKGGQKE